MRKSLATILLASIGLAGLNAAGGNQLLLRNGNIDMPDNAASFAAQYHPKKDELFAGHSYLVVQFSQIPTQELRMAIEADGIQLLDYLPENAYLAAVPKDYDLRKLISAGARSFMAPGANIRLSKSLYSGNYPDWAFDGSNLELVLKAYEGVTKSEMANEIGKYYAVNADFLHPELVQVTVPASRLYHLLQFPMIQFIEPIAAPSTKDDYPGRSLHRSNAINTFYSAGRHYDGTDVHVALADDGLIGPHIDFTGRLTQFATANSGTHGDMTGGIFFGAGNREPRVQGHASGATAYYWDISGYPHVVNAVTNFNTYGIVLSSTSYSQGTGGVYTNDTQFIDGQIYNNRQFVHVFSAGNAGSADHGYGAGAGWGNITGGYKAGKNVITCGDMNNNGILESTSSRGPADDGRIKPDICANGFGQLSTDENNTTQTGSGTSAAAPSVAGTVTQLYHAYKSLNGGQNPESGLIKACVLNTGNDAGNVGPDYRYGWGRINALRAVRILEQNRYMLDSVTQGQTRSHTINIPANTYEVRVMVYWTDPAGNPAAAKALVNDLNMQLTVGGTTYNPWRLDPTPNATALNTPAVRGLDDLNNMEQVTVLNPAAGNATLTINGFAVPQGPQRFWVVYEFVQQGVELTYPIGGEGFVPGETEKIRWDGFGINSNYTLEYSTNNGSSWTTISSAITSTAHTYNWVVPTTVSGEVQMRISSGSFSDVTDANFTIARLPTNINITYVCPDSIGITWSAAVGATGYEVSILGNKYMDSVAYSGTTSATIYGQNPTVEHWYSVRSLQGQGKGRRAIAVRRAGGTFNCVVPVDAELSQINSPGAGSVQSCQASATTPVTIEVMNNGSSAASNIPVHYRINGGTPVNEVLAGPLASGASTSYTFSSTVNMSTPGTYVLDAWVNLTGDGNSYNDTLSQTTTISSGSTVSLPQNQNFESFTACNTGADCGATVCALGLGWTNETNGLTDDIDWRVDAGGTPSAGTGPSVDHNPGTSTGKYVYLEASGSCTAQTANLLSPCIDLSSSIAPQLTFWYHMYGTSMGELHVDVIANGVWTLDVMSPIYGDRGNAWYQSTVNLSPFAGQVINVRFRGITGSDFTSDMALDDIGLIEASTPPAVSFVGSPLSTCPGSTVQLTDMSVNSPNAWAWTISPNTFSYVNGTSASSQNPQVQFSAAGTYTVSLTATNAFGSGTGTQTNYITISNGAVPNVVEDFQGSFLPAGWAVLNSGGAYTWTQSQSITGISGTPTLAAYVENFSYNSPGALDYLVMEPIDLSSSAAASLQFDLAYARYSATLFERLYIEVSTDCGQTFPNVVFDKSDTVLATVGDQAGNWFPSAAGDWRTETVDLMPYLGSTIVIRFVNVNGYGNNLFLDNINVTQTVGINPSLGQLGMNVWPNPNAGTFNVSVPKLAAGPAAMSVFDLTGRKVFSNEWLADGDRYQTVVDLRSMTKGVYFLKLESQGMSAIQKVIIE